MIFVFYLNFCTDLGSDIFSALFYDLLFSYFIDTLSSFFGLLFSLSSMIEFELVFTDLHIVPLVYICYHRASVRDCGLWIISLLDNPRPEIASLELGFSPLSLSLLVSVPCILVQDQLCPCAWVSGACLFLPLALCLYTNTLLFHYVLAFCLVVTWLGFLVGCAGSNSLALPLSSFDSGLGPFRECNVEPLFSCMVASTCIPL